MEWQEARDWMLQAKAFPPGHPGVRSDAGLDDFAKCLRDGVFLCELLNKIIPDAVQHYHRKATLEFKCIQNINSFLMSVSMAFGISDDDLFLPNDLFELSDFSAVVKCLSALSRTDSALATGLDPFPRGLEAATKRVEEDIYGNLEVVALTTKATGSSQQPGADDEFSHGGEELEIKELIYTESQEEDIYGSMIQFNKTASESSTGAGFAGLPEKLGHVVAELVETEKSYVDVLNILSEHYIVPLVNLLDESVTQTIFINLAELREVHNGFLAQLQAQVEEGALQISKCFLNYADEFVNYGTYCACLAASQKQVQELMDKPDMAKTLDNCKKASKQRFNLKELLSVPMQRVLKYPLLLRELIKQGNKCSYGDVAGLEQASEALKDVAKSVNEIKRDIEALNTVREIQTSLLDYKGETLSTFGRSLLDGEVRIKNVEDPKPKSRYAFLFDKVLIICKNKGDRFSFKKILKLEEYGFEDMAQSTLKGKFSFAFQIQGRTATAAANSCLFYAKTAQAKTEWLKLVNNALANISRTGATNNGHNFELTTVDCQTQRCSVCRRLMWGLILQGYKCSLCECIVHGDCLTDYTTRCHGQAQGFLADRQNIRRTVTRVKDQWMGGRGSAAPASAATTTSPSPNRSTYEHADLRFPGRGSITSNDSASGGAKRTLPLPPTPTAQAPTSPTALAFSRAQPLTVFSWFVGKMSRQGADKSLLHSANAVYLVRESESRPGSYALSIKWSDSSKHIKIVEENEEFYLTKRCRFPDIPTMISHYTSNSLVTSFPGLQTSLQTGFGDTTSRCIAQYDFTARSAKEMSIEEDCEIFIYARTTKESGWWYGSRNGVAFGLFPANYVEEID